MGNLNAHTFLVQSQHNLQPGNRCLQRDFREQASAEVVYVDPLIDPSSGTFRVKLEIAPTDSVSAGLAARLLISNPDIPEE